MQLSNQVSYASRSDTGLRLDDSELKDTLKFIQGASISSM